MKSISKYFWIFLTIGIIIAIIPNVLNYNDLIQLIFGGIGYCFLGIAGIFQYTHSKQMKKKQIENLKIEENKNNNYFLLHSSDNHVTKVIYNIYTNEIDEIKNIIKNSCCYIEYEYAPEDNTYAIYISDVNINSDSKDFAIALYSNNDRQVLEVNDDEIDVSTLTEQEIIDKLICFLNSFVVKTNFENFEINLTPKRHLFAGIFVFILSIVALTFLIINVKYIEIRSFIPCLLLIILFLILSILIFYVYKNHKLIVDDNRCIYKNPFKKAKQFKINSIKKVYFEIFNNISKTVFVDNNNNVIFSFIDNIDIINNRQFKQYLNYYSITYNILI